MPAIDTQRGKPAKRVRRAKPSPTAAARAQEQQYASQGAAVEKAANTQRKTAVRKQQLARSKPMAGDAPQARAKDLERAQAYVKGEYRRAAAADKARHIVKAPNIRAPYKQGTTVPPDVAERAKERASRVHHQAVIGARVAPVLRVLDQTTRPLHAVAGASDAAVTGKNVLHAASRGIQNKDRTTFSDVLKHAGVKNKTVRTVAGFGLDVGLDPTTYVTGGTAALARKPVEKAAESATKKALAKGLTQEQAARFGERAAKQAAKTAPKGSGVTVKFAGKSVPGVTRASAAAGRAAGKAGRKVTPTKVREGVRSVGADVNPNVTPVGAEKATSKAAIQATRRARSEANQGTRHAVDVAHGIKSQIGKENYAKVVDAIEAQNIRSLPGHLRPHAVKLRSELRHVRKVQRRAGVKVPERKGYVPRQLTEEAAQAEGKATAGGIGQRVIKPKSSKARTETRPMKTLREQKPGRYREDLHALIGERLAEGTSSAAKATLNRRLGELGRTIKRGEELTLKDGESVYHIKGSDIRRVTDNKELARIVRPLRMNKEGTKLKGANKQGGRFVVLNDEVVKRAIEGSAAALQGPGIVRGLDKTTGAFKRLALATPGFHIRNLVGDTFQGYVNQPGRTLAGNIVRARRVTKALGEQEKAARRLEHPGSVAKKDIQNQPVRRVVSRVQRAARLQYASNDALAKSGPASLDFGSTQFKTPGIHRMDSPSGKSSEYWFHDQKGKAVGYLFVGKKGRDVFVDPAYRRQGIASSLYKRAAADGYDVTKRVGARTDLGDALNRSMRKPAPSGKTLKTGKYGHVSYEDIAHNLVAAGAARSGYTARELKELSTSGQKGFRVTRPKAPAGAKRLLLNREDIPRLATAIHALQNGATWEEAAQKVADVHFDYGHLTHFERNIARRIMPFYTWTARNIPFTAKNVVARPGKYANFQKIREEGMKASQPGQVDQQTKDLYAQLEKAGVKLPGGWERYLSEYEQRNAGVPISIGGKKFTESMGLPLQDLNEFPGAALGNQLSEYYQKGMSLAGPIPKDLIEYFDNHSFYFRDQLERDHSPNVAAPAYAAHLPGPIKKWAGVKTIIDKKTGKHVLGWKGKADYVFKSVPGTPNYIQQFMTSGSDRRGKGTLGKALAFAGLKSVPIDPVKNAMDLAYKRQQEIQKQLSSLSQQGVNKSNPTPEWRHLNDQLKIINQIAFQSKAKQGYKVLPKQGGPPKTRGGGGGVRVRLGGSGGGRVKLGGSGSGRVKLN